MTSRFHPLRTVAATASLALATCLLATPAAAAPLLYAAYSVLDGQPEGIGPGMLAAIDPVTGKVQSRMAIRFSAELGGSQISATPTGLAYSNRNGQNSLYAVFRPTEIDVPVLATIDPATGIIGRFGRLTSLVDGTRVPVPYQTTGLAFRNGSTDLDDRLYAVYGDSSAGRRAGVSTITTDNFSDVSSASIFGGVNGDVTPTDLAFHGDQLYMAFRNALFGPAAIAALDPLTGGLSQSPTIIGGAATPLLSAATALAFWEDAAYALYDDLRLGPDAHTLVSFDPVSGRIDKTLRVGEDGPDGSFVPLSSLPTAMVFVDVPGGPMTPVPEPGSLALLGLGLGLALWISRGQRSRRPAGG